MTTYELNALCINKRWDGSEYDDEENTCLNKAKTASQKEKEEPHNETNNEIAYEQQDNAEELAWEDIPLDEIERLLSDAEYREAQILSELPVGVDLDEVNAAIWKSVSQAIREEKTEQAKELDHEHRQKNTKPAESLLRAFVAGVPFFVSHL